MQLIKYKLAIISSVYNHCMHISCVHSVCTFVGSCLATEVFIGNLLAMGRGWVIIKLANDEQRSTTNKIVICQ